ncbi:MAG TPA: RNA 2',3'-cyclic phosphodiesterase [Planctomycetota bacterium]
MRCFVAVEVPEEVRGLLVRVQEALRRADADVKWVERENLHLTLKFLGDLGEEAAGRLGGTLAAEAARWPRLRLSFGGIGVFPERGAPRVVWAGCAGDVERLAGLAGAVERAAEAEGVERERHPFVAHLTIGRVKSARNEKRLRAAIENQRVVPLGTSEVAELALIQSTLTSAGPVYERVATFRLG